MAPSDDADESPLDDRRETVLVADAPYTLTSQTPLLRVPARNTRPTGLRIRSPTYALGSPVPKLDQLWPPSRVWYTPRSAATHSRSTSVGSTAMALTGRAGRFADRSCQVVPPSVDSKTRAPPTVRLVTHNVSPEGLTSRSLK